RGFLRPARIHLQVDRASEPDLLRPDPGPGRRPRLGADGLPDVLGGRDPPRTVRRPPRCGAGDHAALHDRPGADDPPPPRAVLLAAPPLETRAAGAEGTEGGVRKLQSTLPFPHPSPGCGGRVRKWEAE